MVKSGVISEPLQISEIAARIREWLETPRAEATRAPSAGESRTDGSRTDMRQSESQMDMRRAELSSTELDRSQVIAKREAGIAAQADELPSAREA